MKKLKCSLILLILNLIINNVLSMHKTLEFDSIKLEKYNKLSKQELDKKLLNILNKSNLDKNYLRKCVNLIIAGANINMQNKYGITTLMMVSMKGYLGLVKALLEYTGKEPIDLNIQDENGYTALMEAAFYGHLEIVRILLESENCKSPIDLNLKNKCGNTALDLAYINKKTDIEGLLNKYL
ncbi:ankyrin repeat domain-containing protein [Candidatus Babela massiliensis]|uniref:Ankyrin repeats containing protein n=1 Tax=Candidatus Babela massiliensis TaxID=673862 RepID=V6DH26_9BACT|nr:ankyrin repeat domain-containing protein [Candidatus Babela massiliensis]CDK30238.1 Ankyrin repeats containing protein [Candidatus Babela massiliensis]